MTSSARRVLALAGGAVIVAVLAVLVTLYATGVIGAGQTASPQQGRQERVAARGAEVMPFDLEATTHVFEKTESGGVQKVLADDPGDEQNVAAIREHLREEADAFSRGEFSDPASVHGEEMPGLAELEAGSERMEVRYEELSRGAQIILESDDPELVAAVHEWFDAQISDYGGHAEEGTTYGSRSGEGGRRMEGHDGEQHPMEH